MNTRGLNTAAYHFKKACVVDGFISYVVWLEFNFNGNRMVFNIRTSNVRKGEKIVALKAISYLRKYG